MRERERYRQLALALFRSAAVLENPDLLGTKGVELVSLGGSPF